MKWGDFIDEVTPFLDVDGTRRGASTLRSALIKAAVRDMGALIPEYGIYTNTGSFAIGEYTPFDSRTAEAVAEFVKARLARNIDKDAGIAQLHWMTYLGLRRSLYVACHEAEYPEFKVWIGKPFTMSLAVRRDFQPMPVTAGVWFTVKEFAGQPDEQAVIQLERDSGITVTNEDGGLIEIAITGEKTELLRTGLDYFWDVQVEDEMGDAIIPKGLSGILKARQPVTISNPE